MGIRLSTGTMTPPAIAGSSPVVETTKNSSEPTDRSSVGDVVVVDRDSRKKHLLRVRSSEKMTELLKSAKERYAGEGAIEPEHLALIALEVLKMKAPAKVEKALLESATAATEPGAKGMSERTAQLLIASSVKAGDSTPAPEHLLEALKALDDPFAAHVREVSANHKLEALLAAKSGEVKDAAALKKIETLTPTLSSLGEELVLKGAEGLLDRAVGRSDEIEQILVSLGKRQLSSMVLTGEPGVGKTAIVEGMAVMIANGELPGDLKNGRIFSVTADRLKKAIQPSPQSAVSARAGCTGPSCPRQSDALDAIAAEVAQAEKAGTPIVVFIDEIHQLTSSLSDVTDRLKPYLSRGAIRIIGATTNEEYRKSIFQDAALRDRFPEHRVSAPNKSEALEMVLANLDKFSEFHGVEIDASAAQMAVELSRYNGDTQNPRAAVDWLDLAASSVSYQLGTKPAAIRVLETKIKDTKLAMEHAGAGTIDDPDSQRTYSKLSQKLEKLTEELEETVISAEKERGILDRLQTLGSKLRAAVESDKPDADLVKELRGEIEKERKSLSLLKKRVYHLKVDGAAVAAAVSKKTGIDLEEIKAEDEERFTKIEAKLSERVVGQDHVKAALAKELKLDRAKLRDPKRPIGVHLFAGPTGVGKTELAKTLADQYFDGNLIRFDCNEMMEQHELAKLKGAPPGYVGHDEGSSLAEAIRKHGGRAVLLFDEIEKAHPAILQLLMQIMDEGRFRDNENREVDCTNVEIVFTSNLGSDTFAQYAGDGEYTNESAVKSGFETALAAWAKPEVRNRFTGIHVFDPLGKKDMEKILEVRLKEIDAQLESTHGIHLGASVKAKKLLVEAGFTPSMGGRALNRTVNQNVRVPLAEALISRRYEDGAWVMVDADPKKESALLFRPMSPDEKIAAQTAASPKKMKKAA
jgi:ATP-dependent Clp protease ATP-binding subunit ClpB